MPADQTVRRTQTTEMFYAASLYDLEFLNSLAAVFGDIDVAFGVHGDAVSLIEFTRKVSRTTETRHDLAALAIDDLDFRVVLVDKIDQPLTGIGREIERHRGAAGLFHFSVG